MAAAVAKTGHRRPGLTAPERAVRLAMSQTHPAISAGAPGENAGNGDARPAWLTDPVNRASGG